MTPTRRLPLRKIITGGVIVILLLIVYVFLSSPNRPAVPKPITVNSQVACSFSDQSFCNTQATMKTYVKNNDFSDILENQTPVSVTCDGSSPLQTYCVGPPSNVTIQIYQVVQGQSSGYMTRNDYITFFMSFASQHSPFSYVTTTKSGANVVMKFSNQAKTYQYSLLFTKSAGTWHVSYPTIGPV